MTVALALDLGGTKVEAALVRPDGSIVEGTRRRTATGPHTDAAALTLALGAVCAPSLAAPEWSTVRAAGIGSAGPVDLEAGTVSPRNLPALAGFALVHAVRRLTGLGEVVLRLDGTCIALAESWIGAARGVRNAAVIVVSTGVGGGVISDGRVVAGRTGNAGHLGQVLVETVSTSAAAATVEGIGSGPCTVDWARAQGWTGGSGEELAAACRDGDEVAIAAVARSARAIGAGLAAASTLLDLELAVIGGGFSFVTDDYPDQVQRALRAHAVNDYAAATRVVRAQLGGEAPLVGAAALVHRPELLQG